MNNDGGKKPISSPLSNSVKLFLWMRLEKESLKNSNSFSILINLKFYRIIVKLLTCQ